MSVGNRDAAHTRLGPVSNDDTPFLFALYASTREEELSVVPWTPEQKNAFLRMQFQAQQTSYDGNYPGASRDLILLGEEPIGRLYVQRTPDEIRVIDIALLPAWRGRGIGSRYLRDLCRESDATGIPLAIHVEKQNRALQLYQRLGFAIADDRGVYWFMKRMPAS